VPHPLREVSQTPNFFAASFNGKLKYSSSVVRFRTAGGEGMLIFPVYLIASGIDFVAAAGWPFDFSCRCGNVLHDSPIFGRLLTFFLSIFAEGTFASGHMNVHLGT
jgi:hypothetical protein